jgi:hypothetical protein
MPDKQLMTIKKLVVDDQSLWLEIMYSTEVDSLNDAGAVILDGDNNPIKESEYWHRFKRWDLTGQAYVKVNSDNSLFFKDELEESPVADYLLQENTSLLATEKIWHFLQIDAPYGRGDNAVLSVD